MVEINGNYVRGVVELTESGRRQQTILVSGEIYQNGFGAYFLKVRHKEMENIPTWILKDDANLENELDKGCNESNITLNGPGKSKLMKKLMKELHFQYCSF